MQQTQQNIPVTDADQALGVLQTFCLHSGFSTFDRGRAASEALVAPLGDTCVHGAGGVPLALAPLTPPALAGGGALAAAECVFIDFCLDSGVDGHGLLGGGLDLGGIRQRQKREDDEEEELHGDVWLRCEENAGAVICVVVK